MKVSDLIQRLNCKVLAGESQLGRDVNGGYVCDLLSWVIAHGQSGMALVTVQTHVNIIAVASLLDLACVIVPEDIRVDEAAITKAEEEGVPILSSSKSAFELCGMMYEMGIVGAIRK
ncbi:MAG: DRTGG domain-containing protein [Clostridia bacterium]|jgi:predicted transcriptional regulator